jgi:glycosyltransferase involved in cell wall biosynthesis
MKILYYSPHPNLHTAKPTGYSAHILGIINGLKNKQKEVVPLILGNRSQLTGLEIKEKKATNSLKDQLKKMIPKLIWETLVDVKLLSFDRRVAYKELEKAVREHQPDLIYERANYLQTSGVKIANRYKIPHFLEVNGLYVEQKTYLRGRSLLLPVAKKIEKYQIQHTDKVFSISDALAKVMVKNHGIEYKKFLVSHMAIDPNQIKISDQKVADIKETYDLNENLVIGFVGSIFRWSGVDLLIKAFEELLKKHHNLKLLIIGGGDYLSKILPNIPERVKSKVVFTGWVENKDIYNYIQCIDIPVLANSNWYGSSTKVFEYGALAKPMVVPGTEGIKEIVIDKKDGILIEPGSQQELVLALNFLLENPEKGKQMGEHFQKKVFEGHTWESRVEDITQEWERLKD